MGAGATGAAGQGVVALSSDGNTAIVGGFGDNAAAGAAWVFTRSGGVWTPQGPKLVGTGATGVPARGASVALSADGNTAVVGGYQDNSNAGAVWVFTRSSGVWTQQGPKLVGTGAVGPAQQGLSVALSSDGNTAIVGGFNDNANAGAAWIFNRINGVWSQHGRKLVGAAAAGAAAQGASVALSGNAATALLGGFRDNADAGAMWVFTRRGAHDLDANSVSDMVWRESSGMLGVSTLANPFIGPQFTAFVMLQWSIVAQRDFDGDGKADLLWRDTSGNVAIWLMDGAQMIGGGLLGNVPPSWTAQFAGDFDGDGKADILWRGPDGTVVIWFMNGTQITAAPNLGVVSPGFTISAVGDINGDGKSDIVWRDAAGNVYLWFMNGGALIAGPGIGAAPASWQIVGTGDFNGDGRADLLWRGPAGEVATWIMTGNTAAPFVAAGPQIGQAPLTWQTQGVGDYNNDGKADILWRETVTGEVALRYMDGATLVAGPLLGAMPTSWTIQNPRAD